MTIDFPPRIMARIPDLVAYLDSELRYCYANEAYQKALGFTAEGLEGKTVFDVLPKETLSINLSRMRSALAGKDIEFDSHVQLPGADRKWLFARYIPDFNEMGVVIGFFAIVTDVTARKEAEINLQRVMSLCDELPTLMAHCDAQERYLYVNRAYASNYGRSRQETIGLRVSDVVPPVLYEKIGPKIHDLLMGHPVEFDVPIPRIDGTIAWVSVRGIPEFSGSEVVGFFVILSDISKHKELERLRRDFTTSNVRTQEAERKALAQELHDGIAQELAALALISNMLKPDTGKETIHSTSIMLQEGLQRTVNEIRRLSYGLHPLEISELGLLNAIGEFLSRTRQVHPNVTIDLTNAGIGTDVSAGPDVDIAAYRIMQEATSNALRHANPSRVELQLQLDNDNIIGKISDNGLGFEPDQSLRGFGLASMRERATLFGGSLHIASNEDGTIVEFTIPCRQPKCDAPSTR